MVSVHTDAVNETLVKQGLDLYHASPTLDKGTYLSDMSLHWQVGTWTQTSCEYNYETCMDEHGNWVMRIEQDPRHNAIEISEDAPAGSYAAHVYHRNSHNVGCSIAAMFDATPSNFGANPIQDHELEVYLAMCGAVAAKYNIDPLDSSRTKTHAEWAIEDDYFPGDGDPDARWDFERLNPSNAPLSVEEATATAQAMRKRINEYKSAILKAL